MVSCRKPAFPKIVTFTFSSKLASRSLKSVDFEASTVKILRGPSILENVSPLDCFSTLTAAGGGAFLRSAIRCQPRFKYTPAVRQARSSATAADQRAYRAASLLRMDSVKQKSQGLYRSWRKERMARETIRPFRLRPRLCPAKCRCLRLPRCPGSYSSPGTWPHRPGAKGLPWSANRSDKKRHPGSE